MTKKRYTPHDHSGRTGPLDPTLERAHLFAQWDDEMLAAFIPQAPKASDTPFSQAPAAGPGKVGPQP
ncbi:hypothetical protein D3C72_2413870 [compost metagenome]